MNTQQEQTEENSQDNKNGEQPSQDTISTQTDNQSQEVVNEDGDSASTGSIPSDLGTSDQGESTGSSHVSQQLADLDAGTLNENDDSLS